MTSGRGCAVCGRAAAFGRSGGLERVNDHFLAILGFTCVVLALREQPVPSVQASVGLWEANAWVPRDPGGWEVDDVGVDFLWRE